MSIPGHKLGRGEEQLLVVRLKIWFAMICLISAFLLMIIARLTLK
jgi:hypothetical protein